jgi:hypothetical protein
MEPLTGFAFRIPIKFIYKHVIAGFTIKEFFYCTKHIHEYYALGGF